MCIIQPYSSTFDALAERLLPPAGIRKPRRCDRWAPQRPALTTRALHLLKLRYQPARRSRSWLATITRERLNAARLLRDNPSLKAKRLDIFASAYLDARKEAASATGLAGSTFPIDPPFSLDELIDPDFCPRPNE